MGKHVDATQCRRFTLSVYRSETVQGHYFGLACQWSLVLRRCPRGRGSSSEFEGRVLNKCRGFMEQRCRNQGSMGPKYCYRLPRDHTKGCQPVSRRALYCKG